MKYLFVFILILINQCSWSQTEKAKPKQSDEVRAIIDSMFMGMRTGDSSIVVNLFHQDVRLMTTYTTKKGQAILQQDDIKEFIKAIGAPHEEIWDERISNVVIHTDDNLAQAWMEYSFYIDNTFSHCGVNAFQLVRLDNQWKIISITDTRRRKECLE